MRRGISLLLRCPKEQVACRASHSKPPPNSGTCISVDGVWDNPKGSVHIDCWYVNRRTGEVWCGVDPVCHRVVAGALTAAQSKVRKQLGVSAEEVRQERNRVCCADVLRPLTTSDPDLSLTILSYRPYLPISSASDNTCPFMARSSSFLAAPAFRLSLMPRAYSLKK